MASRREFTRPYTLVFLHKGSASLDDETRNARLHLEHLPHVTKLQMVGTLVSNGPIRVEHDSLGVSVYAAEVEDARAMAEADPKVRAGYLTVEAIPWIAVPRDTNSG